MSRKAKIWLIVIACLLVFLVLAWFAGTWFGLHGRDLWILRGGLAVLGLIAAIGALVFFLSQPAPPPKPKDPVWDEIDAMLTNAEKRLAASKVGKRALGTMPIVMLLGPEGSTKTSTVVRSGLEADLVTGDVMRGDAVAPTKGVNLWYTRYALFLEAGGALASDATRWARLVHKIQPRRLRAAFTSGKQAPRVAVVCCSCEQLLAGGADKAAAAAQQLRTALGEMSLRLGIRLPVYVIFTKADRVSGFAEYVQNFTAEEARDVLGATLPAAQPEQASAYAEWQTRRLGDAFGQLFRSLAAKRLQFLPRENAPERKPGAYEFPREFRKLTPLATQFLLDLCKPSQLQVNPFLRGFYFSGVRAVMVTESASAAPAQAAAAQQQAAPLNSNATSLFKPIAPGAPGVAAMAAPGAAQAVMKKKPQWVLLERIFPQIVLVDQVAFGLTRGSTRMTALRRGLLGVGCAILFVAALGFTVSFFNNRSLTSDVTEAARAAALAPVDPQGLPSVDALTRLDGLRSQLVRLGEFERNGPPLGYKWGLYSGGRLHAAARRVYFSQFEKQLFGGTRTAVRSALVALPDSIRESVQFDSTYNLLKAYLITGGNNDKSTGPFLGPVLTRRWPAVAQADSARLTLAARQFEFFGTELPFGDPYRVAASPDAVTHARAVLRRSSGVKPIYQYMISEAAQSRPSVQFNRQFGPEAMSVVFNSYEVPGAFTKGGWTYMQSAFKNIDHYVAGEKWVLGEDTGPPIDRVKLVSDLRDMYRQDYVAHWRAYVKATRFVGFGSLKDAAGSLMKLGGPRSPILGVIALASQNSGVDSTTIGKQLQPLLAVVPAGSTDKLVGPTNEPYTGALITLSGNVQQAADAPKDQNQAPVGQAQSSAIAAKGAIAKIAGTFMLDAEAQMSLQRLLEQPVVLTEALLRSTIVVAQGAAGASEINKDAAAFCDAFGELMGKYPFDPESRTEASLGDVSKVFSPGSGSLAAFFEKSLSKAMVRRGQHIAPGPGINTVQPRFLSFYNNALDVSNALYPNGVTQPQLTFALKPVLNDATPNVTFNFESDAASYSSKSLAGAHTFVWRFGRDGTAGIAGLKGANDVSLKGPWAVFRMFHDADWRQPAGGVYTVEGRLGSSARLTVELSLGGAPLLRPSYFRDALQCVPQAVR
jgi:type VI secretion system protein ImpL